MIRRPPAFLFVLCLLGIAALLVAWQYAAARSSGVAAPAGATFWVLQWPQRAVQGVGVWGSDVGRALFRRQGITSENVRLQGEVDNLRSQTQRLARYQAENRELRALLKMKPPRGGTIRAADVIAFDSTNYARRIVLNIGSSAGVRPKDVVYNAQGVVGQVWDVGLATCTVLLLTDRLSGIGSMTGRAMAKGVVKGTGERFCTMSYLDFRADVREGDPILTSGESEIFPRGMVIGRVLQVKRNKNYSQLSAEIEPAVAFDRISVVYVRTGAG
jgi:rod shape-determining protein MreC